MATGDSRERAWRTRRGIDGGEELVETAMMERVPIVGITRHWYCPQCKATDVTHEARPHARYHTCSKLRGLSVAMVPQGTAAKIEVKEREDYINGDLVQLDPEQGRPVMSVVTTRDNGNDVMVFAPTATGAGDTR